MRLVRALIVIILSQFIVRVPPTVVVSGNTVQGYVSRASGFDLNFDGTVGTSAADLAICDGQGDSASTVGEDIDGNGVNDRQVYVDLTSGTNNATCGLPSAPCLTIQYAMNGTNASVTGGPIQSPAASQIQAICFKGIGREQIDFKQSGAAGVYTLAATGNQTTSFNLPRYPFILSGWDADNDNKYPPFDTDDVAVLDGDFGGTSLPFAIDNGASAARSRIELAHFTARDYGLNNADTSSGFAHVAYGGGSVDAIYYHDIETTGILKGMANQSGRDTFMFFTSSSLLSNIAIVNVSSTESGGGYWVRGSGIDSIQVLGPYRFQSVTVTGYGASSDFWAGMKLFDTITGIEVIDSVFTSNAAAWSPAPTGAPTFGLGLSPCTRGWRVINNTFNDFKAAISIQGYADVPGFCETRTLTDVLIDRNTIRQTYSTWNTGGPDSHGINIDPGLTDLATSADIQISNNFLSTTVGWDDCMRIDQGNPSATNPGTIVIVGNTCDGDVDSRGAIVIGNLGGAEQAFPEMDFVVKDNIISGIVTAGMWNFRTLYVPTNWVADGNVFVPSMIWNWGGTDKTTLANWQSASGGDSNSFQCAPTFVNSGAGNFRLTGADSCARDKGVSISAYTVVDIDKLVRPFGSATDIGAAEYR